MLKIGLLGGISAASTQEYYATILDKYYKANNDYYYPEIVINSLNFQYFTDLENQRRTEEYIAYIVGGVRALEVAGVDFVAMTANSPHSVYPQVREQAVVPMVSIVEAVGAAILEKGLKKVLLTGIKYTMESDFYPQGLASLGIEVVVPDQKDRVRIDDMIFGELVLNQINENTRGEFVSILDNYDVEGVILGCTELPLLLEDYRKPLLDSLDIHCQAILDYACTTSNRK